MGKIRRLRDSKGANMVEAAIITPLLLLLTFGIVDFAAMFYVTLALENGVSQATRYGITGASMTDPGTGATMTREASIKQAMRTATPTLTIADSAFTFTHMAPGAGGWSGGIGGPRDIARVQVQYTWTFYTPLVRPFFPNGQINVRVDSTMKNEGWAE